MYEFMLTFDIQLKFPQNVLCQLLALVKFFANYANENSFLRVVKQYKGSFIELLPDSHNSYSPIRLHSLVSCNSITINLSDIKVISYMTMYVFIIICYYTYMYWYL